LEELCVPGSSAGNRREVGLLLLFGTYIMLDSLVLIGLAVVGYIGYRKLKEQRRSHGEYRPQFEEYQHAKNLPYLQPPSIEGLI
uniref:T-cell surface glycoprotein CD3 zeta chain n=1 Tax=Gongylonema pulchrum TaxID=637853 RepID=A0A183CX13_9BILA